MCKEFEIEEIKKDLDHQLKFEEMNWDYFIETAERAKVLAEKNDTNFLE
jgi:hypothetical protein